MIRTRRIIVVAGLIRGRRLVGRKGSSHGSEKLHDEYLDRQKFEHELINRRVTWLLASQSILFAAYGLGFSGNGEPPLYFFIIVAGCGLLSSLFLFSGIFAGACAKWCSWRDYLYLDGLNNINRQNQSLAEKKHNELRREWGVRNLITILALAPDLFLPLLFFGAWATLLLTLCFVGTFNGR